MGGTQLKTIELQDDAFPLFKFDAQIYSWETCLWRIKVYGDIWFNHLRLAFEYEASDRSVRLTNESSSCIRELSSKDEETIRMLCDLALIRAINPSYYTDAIRDDGDLRLSEMYRKYIDISEKYN